MEDDTIENEADEVIDDTYYVMERMRMTMMMIR